MPNRFRDWFRQAERDLEHSRDSQRAGRHEWACFAAHQATEKALKALHLKFGQEAWGHVLVELVLELPSGIAAPEDFVENARVLDNFYVPTRPNGHPSGAPFEHYGPLQSEQAINYPDQIIAFARAAMARRRTGDGGGAAMGNRSG